MQVDKALLEKYYQGRCSQAEIVLVERWLMEYNDFDGLSRGQNIPGSESRMWRVIRRRSLDYSPARKSFTIRSIPYALSIAVACMLLLISGIYLWKYQGDTPAVKSYVIVDNTRGSMLSKQKLGRIVLSESANGKVKKVALSDRQGYQLFANSLTIDNQKGEDIWVYLKTSSEKGSGMLRFLCKRQKTYVVGYVTEWTKNGSHKYLYSRQSGKRHLLPAKVVMSINSQLNAVKKSNACKRNATVII